MIGIKFGSFDMQQNGVRVIDAPDLYSAPTNAIQADELAERDGSLVVKQTYKSKSFQVSGLLRTDTRAQVETLRDTFMLAMAQHNQALDFDYGGTTRRYLANAESVILSEKSLSTFAFTVKFLSPDGMGWDLGNTSLITPTGVSTSSASIALTVGGTYKTEPLITVVVNTLTVANPGTITIGNGVTLRSMSVARTWAAGDRLEVNTQLGTVFVNSVPTDFTGQFPEFAPGAGTLTYLDTFTARDVTVTATYAKRWL